MTLFSRIVALAFLKYFILQADAHLTKIQHHITGVKVHSSDRNFIFTWTDLFHPNSNITMNCLVHVLDEVCKVNCIYIQSRKRWDLNYGDIRQSYCKAVMLCTGQVQDPKINTCINESKKYARSGSEAIRTQIQPSKPKTGNN